ncbi:glutamine--fructose-6-phosphate transaminase (isomerizing) [Trebonia kvetii]|uniref:Glutamine--fructose-6-phosphate aminotransferase [isomerizing] n=1 Tax=Trebonia kvetii TaxID=2480626 RepID=A0A6P2C3S2_9ACTN|nr:glutamine--fructose-6-phosphate transaminase (isomerizing) [Trebonia kvetii]TVZ06072.1 glutamine--fructose-6-phosphate transaminase (isomerizing) [Trebonia kvetii]
MCGIVGYIGKRDATPVLLEGLHRLEYRGYDSAGLALVRRGRLQITKTAGRVQDLRDKIDDGRQTTKATIGIGHTRWATHGEPNERNAHPHTDTAQRIALVHNGIIENADQLRDQLTGAGVTLVSDTDTEALAHMIAAELAAIESASLSDAVVRTLRRVEGAYGLVVLDLKNPDELVVARKGSPIVLGLGENEMFVASDVAALVRYTRQVIYLEDGEVATISATDYRTTTLSGPSVSGDGHRTPTTVDAQAEDYELGPYSDYMRKEIHEQPDAIRRAVMGRLDERFATAKLGGLNFDPRELRNIKRVKFLGCGSAYYAGQMGAALVEELARIPADAEPASEFRYRSPVVDPDALYVAVSQSGETSDTLMAVQELKRKGGQVMGAVNVVGSAIGRECGHGIFLHAGPEVAVASTKALTNMAVNFALLALLLGRVRDLSAAQGERVVRGLRGLPSQVTAMLNAEDEIAAIASEFADADHMFFIGRVRGWPVAREGAQKLKEISYVHAEAYQAGELKHGPLALIAPDMPSVVVIPSDDLVAKNISTIEQIKARGGPVIAVTSTDIPAGLADALIRVPRTEPELEPILFNIPLQLLAYHTAAKLGRDIDKPRNLAKSVTVE